MLNRDSRQTPTAACRRGAPLLMLAGLLILPPAAGADDRLDALRRVVDEACACAALRSGGLDAAVKCTAGPRAFGSIKVAAWDAWNDARRAEAATLEQVIETCIANAIDHTTARQRLGLAAQPGSPGAAPTVWTQIRVSDLGSYPTRLARIHVTPGAPMKGLVESATADEVVLRRARRDGGGSERIPVSQIREAWIMDLR